MLRSWCLWINLGILPSPPPARLGNMQCGFARYVTATSSSEQSTEHMLGLCGSINFKRKQNKNEFFSPQTVAQYKLLILSGELFSHKSKFLHFRETLMLPGESARAASRYSHSLSLQRERKRL